MPETIDHGRVQQLLAAGATLIDVLPNDEYRDEHIAGAISIPLRQLDRASIAELTTTQPVIVYCWDLQ